MNDPGRHDAADAPAAPRPVRVAINLGNAALVRVGEHDGEPHGIAVDLGRRLGAWLGRPVRLVIFPSAGALIASVGDEAWDVAFIAVDPARADRVAYSRPYLRIEGVFAVRAASSPRSRDDVDRPQVRIASAAGAAYHAQLSRSLRHAELVTVPTPDDALRLLCEGGCDVAAGVRQAVEAFAAGRDDLRLLPGRFMTIDQAIAVPLHGALGAEMLDRFLAHATATGMIEALPAEGGASTWSAACRAAVGRCPRPLVTPHSPRRTRPHIGLSLRGVDRVRKEELRARQGGPGRPDAADVRSRTCRLDRDHPLPARRTSRRSLRLRLPEHSVRRGGRQPCRTRISVASGGSDRVSECS